MLLFAGAWLGAGVLAALSGVFMVMGKRKGAFFANDYFIPKGAVWAGKPIGYRDVSRAVITHQRVALVLKDGREISIPLTAGTWAVISHLTRVGVKVEHQLKSYQWHRVQKSLLLWDRLEQNPVLRTHGWMGFLAGIPAGSIYLSLVANRGDAFSALQWLESSLFVFAICAAASVCFWGLFVLYYRFSSGTEGEHLTTMQSRAGRTDLWAGLATALCLGLALYWFHEADRSAARAGRLQPEIVAQAFGRPTSDRAPASIRP